MENLQEYSTTEIGEPMPQADSSTIEKTHSNNDVDVDPGNDGYVSPEHTRSTVALLFIIGFFSILFLCFVYAIVTGAKLSEVKDILVAIIGALSGTLGFIVGYYYKSDSK